MTPIDRITYSNPAWATDAYWEKIEAREKLIAAKQRAQRMRPTRSRRAKLAAQARRKNRRKEG